MFSFSQLRSTVFSNLSIAICTAFLVLLACWASFGTTGFGNEPSFGSTEAAKDWPLRVFTVRQRRTSQGFQDGMLQYIFKHIGTTNKYYVEFGFNSRTYRGGTGANTYHLNRHFGWSGLLMDGEFKNPKINLRKEMISPENIVFLFEKHQVPKEFDYLSVDIDSVDFWVLRAIFTGGYRPRVVTAEHNCHLAWNSTITVSNNPAHRNEFTLGKRMYGASITAYAMMAKEFNYTLVSVDGVLDVFLVRDDLLLGRPTPPLSTFAHLGNVSFHACCQSDERIGTMLWSYKTWLQTHDEKAAGQAAFMEVKEMGLQI